MHASGHWSSRYKRLFRLLAGCSVAMLGSAAQAFAQNSLEPFYVSFQVPGAGSTVSTSINAVLSVAGFYLDTQLVRHGFVRSTLAQSRLGVC
jgi:hypothetical protein